MEVKKVMTHNVETISPESTVKEAARRMKDFDIGDLPVWDGKHLVGILTDRDIVVRVIAEGKDTAETKVKDVMSTKVECCFEDQSIKEVVRKMEMKQIRRMPIINHDEILTGMISLGDIAEKCGSKLAFEALYKICEPYNVKH